MCIRDSYGLALEADDAQLTGVSVRVDGGNNSQVTGLFSRGANLLAQDVQIEAVNPSSTTSCRGIYTIESPSAKLRDVFAESDGWAMVLDNPGTTLEMDDCVAIGGELPGIMIRTIASAPAGNHHAHLRNVRAIGGTFGISVSQMSQPLYVTFEGGYLHGPLAPAKVIDASLNIASTQIKSGGVVTDGSGTATCSFVWDGQFNAFVDTCP